MPPPLPDRPDEYSPEQWEAACAAAKKNAGTQWENPPYAGKTNPDGWRFSQCYMRALQMYPPTPAGTGAKAARALRKGEKGNPAGGRSRRHRRRSRRTFRQVRK